MTSQHLPQGTVKSVLSGDTLVIRGRPLNGPPPEKVLSLAWISAPRMSNSPTSPPSEPHAFKSREFLRKLLVGKSVEFQVEYSSPGREFVSLFLDGENVGDLVIKAGWARVRREEEESLMAFQLSAQTSALGLWASSTDGSAAGGDDVKFSLDDPVAFAQHHKNKRVKAIVEQVRDGSTFRLLFPDESQMAVCVLAGIKCPVTRRNVPNMEDLVEPFADEAKFFVESRLLQRDVEVVVAGCNHQTLIVNVSHPAGNIALSLLENGFARLVDWGVPFIASGEYESYKRAEMNAKSKLLRIWRGFKAPVVSASDSFTATVVRVMSGDTVLVESDDGVESRFTLSSVRQPNPQSEPYWCYEAKEFMRKKLIGKRVLVEIDYRKPPMNGMEERVCASLTLGSMLVAEAMVAKGLLYVLRHRQDDDNRSRIFDKLLLAEVKAKEGQVGVYGKEPTQPLRISDASENVAKARSFLPFFKRAGRISATVEHVISGSKFRMYISKDNCKFSFSLSGVRCPRVARLSNEKSEPFGSEALKFTERKTLQRDVEVEVDDIDRTGGFVGTLWLSKSENFATSLLTEGLAFVYGFSADNSPYSNEMYTAENQARTASKNIWSVYEEDHTEQTVEVTNEVHDVVVTEITDGISAYVQYVGDDQAQLRDLMKEMEFTIKSSLASPNIQMKTGELLAAKFSLDNQWYRGKIRRVISKTVCEIFYIDYGNCEEVPVDRLHHLDRKFLTLPPQAHEFKLSYIVCPAIEEEYGVESAEYFKELASAGKLKAWVDLKKGSLSYVTLFVASEVAEVTPKLINLSVNAKMLKQGYAQLDKKSALNSKNNKDSLSVLREAEQFARLNRLGMFEYGDFDLQEEPGM